MDSEPVLFDPEFEAILREVAADPHSSLLRVKRPQVLGELFDQYSPISTQATGLTKAERHLLQVHRNEIAWLLRQACLIKLIEGPSSKRFVSRFAAPGKEVTLLAPAEMEASVRERRERSSDLEECTHGLDLLAQCVADRRGEEPRVAELATAAFRLEPTDQARLMVGYDLVLREEARSSLRLMRRVLMNDPAERDAARAWACVGMCFTDMGDLTSAHQAFREGSSQSEPEILNSLLRLVFGLQLGMEADVLDCSRRLDELLSPDDPAVEWFVQVLLQRRGARQWVPTKDGTRLAGSLRERLGRTGGRIANVLV